MKYCVHCGKELEDDVEVCPECNTKCADKIIAHQKEIIINKQNEKPLKGKDLGVLLGVLTGVVGLILCLIMGDKDCKHSCVKAFIITTVVLFLVALLYVYIQTL